MLDIIDYEMVNTIMDIETAQLLCQINNEFYAHVSESFSATRQAPWTGWVRCVDALQDAHVTEIADIACGNLRFETYALSRIPDAHVYAVDDCEQLLPEEISDHVTFQRIDVIQTLLDPDMTVAASVQGAPFDAVVSYGFMHHIPGRSLRIQYLNELLDMVKPGGYIMVSLWQFMNNEGLAQKAQVTHAAALDGLAARGLDVSQLEPGDYFLGWKDTQGVYRYCHHFTAGEGTALAEAVADRARLVDRFEADGRTGDLNGYLILQKMGVQQ